MTKRVLVDCSIDFTMRIGDSSEHVAALGAALPALATGLLFALVLWRGPEGLAAGDFLVVYAASLLSHQTLVRFGGSFETVADILPAVSQVQPILEATPHAPPAGRAGVTLDGGIRFDHVSFRYEPDGALILDDVSLHARAGEFIAIVGETGSGKSTLVRCTSTSRIWRTSIRRRSGARSASSCRTAGSDRAMSSTTSSARRRT